MRSCDDGAIPMTRSISLLSVAAALGALVMLPAYASGQPQTARTRYEDAQARETTVRSTIDAAAADADAARAAIDDARSVISAYQAIVRRYPVSGYRTTRCSTRPGLPTRCIRSSVRPRIAMPLCGCTVASARNTQRARSSSKPSPRWRDSNLQRPPPSSRVRRRLSRLHQLRLRQRQLRRRLRLPRRLLRPHLARSSRASSVWCFRTRFA